MRLKIPIVLAAMLFAASGAAQEVSPEPSGKSGQSEGSLASGMTINAELNSSVDSKKAKAGEGVIAHTTAAVKSQDGRTILPAGTKLIGHVTQASARAKGAPDSALGIQFDKAVLKDGQEIPLSNVTIQALAAVANPGFGLAPNSEPIGGALGSNSPASNPSISGSRGARPATATAESNPYPGGTEGGTGVAAGPLASQSRGVYGLPGLSLAIATSGKAEVSVITSNGKNVHLDGGTRLLLVSQPEAAAASPAQ
jgi:hypothetical protein